MVTALPAEIAAHEALLDAIETECKVTPVWRLSPAASRVICIAQFALQYLAGRIFRQLSTKT